MKLLDWMRYKALVIVIPIAVAAGVAFAVAMIVSYVEINESKYTARQVGEQAVAATKKLLSK